LPTANETLECCCAVDALFSFLHKKARVYAYNLEHVSSVYHYTFEIRLINYMGQEHYI
jgi:hypothetical protein